MVAALILAAGRSRRMGRPKALLLTPAGHTFVAQLVETLALGGVESPFVVGRPDDDALKRQVESFGERARWVANPLADTGGQLSSVLVGLDKADRPGVGGLMVVPVDAPMITSQTIATLLSTFRAGRGLIVRARYQGRNGHPVVFAREVFDDLRRADPAMGAKAVLRARSGDIIDVDVDDAGVAGDIDTPEDYGKLVN
jgi:molybdenum cofactor cytidylyltransferase